MVAPAGPATWRGKARSPTPHRPHHWWRWFLRGRGVLPGAACGAAYYYLWHIPLPGPPPLPQASVVYDANGRGTVPGHVLRAEPGRRTSDPGSQRQVIDAVVVNGGSSLLLGGCRQSVEHHAGVRRGRHGVPLSGRLHHHRSNMSSKPTVGSKRTLVLQDQGSRSGQFWLSAQGVEGPDPAELSQHHLLGPGRLRRGGGLARLLRQERSSAPRGRWRHLCWRPSSGSRRQLRPRP